jgi:hypothetical protein
LLSAHPDGVGVQKAFDDWAAVNDVAGLEGFTSFVDRHFDDAEKVKWADQIADLIKSVADAENWRVPLSDTTMADAVANRIDYALAHGDTVVLSTHSFGGDAHNNDRVSGLVGRHAYSVVRVERAGSATKIVLDNTWAEPPSKTSRTPVIPVEGIEYGPRGVIKVGIAHLNKFDQLGFDGPGAHGLHGPDLTPPPARPVRRTGPVVESPPHGTSQHDAEDEPAGIGNDDVEPVESSEAGVAAESETPGHRGYLTTLFDDEPVAEDQAHESDGDAHEPEDDHPESEYDDREREHDNSETAHDNSETAHDDSEYQDYRREPEDNDREPPDDDREYQGDRHEPTNDDREPEDDSPASSAIEGSAGDEHDLTPQDQGHPADENPNRGAAPKRTHQEFLDEHDEHDPEQRPRKTLRREGEDSPDTAGESITHSGDSPDDSQVQVLAPSPPPIDVTLSDGSTVLVIPAYRTDQTVDPASVWVSHIDDPDSDTAWRLVAVDSDPALPRPWTVDRPVFEGEPSPLDVAQGDRGTCHLLCVLMHMAARNPVLITEMVRDYGDGDVDVRFFDDDGTAVWIRVDKTFYRGPDGSVYGAKVEGKPLWPAIIEKAYAAHFGEGQGYAGIEGGYAGVAARRMRPPFVLDESGVPHPIRSADDQDFLHPMRQSRDVLRLLLSDSGDHGFADKLFDLQPTWRERRVVHANLAPWQEMKEHYLSQGMDDATAQAELRQTMEITDVTSRAGFVHFLAQHLTPDEAARWRDQTQRLIDHIVDMQDDLDSALTPIVGAAVADRIDAALTAGDTVIIGTHVFGNDDHNHERFGGLLGGHAYSVLEVVRDDAGNPTDVTLQDPSGHPPVSDDADDDEPDFGIPLALETFVEEMSGVSYLRVGDLIAPGGVLTVSLDHLNKFNLLSCTGLGAVSIYGDEEVVASNVYELVSNVYELVSETSTP